MIKKNWLKPRLKFWKFQKILETQQESWWDNWKRTQMCKEIRSWLKTTRTTSAPWPRLLCMKWLNLNNLHHSKEMLIMNLRNKANTISWRNKTKNSIMTLKESMRSTRRDKMTLPKNLKRVRMKSLGWRKLSMKPKLTRSYNDNTRRERLMANFNVWNAKIRELKKI